ncbi:MAG TPA: hypothetical protein VM029_15785, partial [Opitutaceae bacterium]|nr:hypothetical protein [Opitutaceae bacterium]
GLWPSETAGDKAWNPGAKRYVCCGMSYRFILAFLCAAGLGLGAATAETATSPEDKKLSPKDAVKARMMEDGKKKSATPPAPAPAKSENSDSTSAAAAPLAATPAMPATPAAANAKAAAQPPTVLPRVEVKKGRITELDQKLAKQEKDIEREKQHTKSSEVDKALNDSKVAKTLSFLGGESSNYRENIAKERVSLMEAERDIMEAMKTARTKEEKAGLQKQLDQLKSLRRDLEASMK